MRKIPEYLATSGKGTKNTQSKKGKMFGYQVLGFGAGGSKPPYEIQMMVVAGGGSGAFTGGGGGAGGYRTSTQQDIPAG